MQSFKPTEEGENPTPKTRPLATNTYVVPCKHARVCARAHTQSTLHITLLDPQIKYSLVPTLHNKPWETCHLGQICQLISGTPVIKLTESV